MVMQFTSHLALPIPIMTIQTMLSELDLAVLKRRVLIANGSGLWNLFLLIGYKVAVNGDYWLYFRYQTILELCFLIATWKLLLCDSDQLVHEKSAHLAAAHI